MFWKALVGERWVNQILKDSNIHSGNRWYNFSGFHSGCCSYYDGTFDFLNPASKWFCSDTWKELAVSNFKMNLDQWNVTVSTWTKFSHLEKQGRIFQRNILTGSKNTV
jgi:hypothetical protein